MIRLALIVIAALVLTGTEAQANYAVVGDSLSSEPGNWFDLVFPGEINEAIGGQSTHDFLAICDNFPSTCWANSGDADTVWFIMIGHNDPVRSGDLGLPLPGYDDRVEDMVTLVNAKTGATDFRLITSPYTHDAFGTDRSAQRAWQDDMALMDQDLCASDPLVTCVLDLRPVLLWPDHYIWDGVHLNEAGNDEVALLVPEPSAGLSLLAGLLGLGILRKKRALR